VEQVRRQRHVGAEGDGVGLAVVEALELRELLGVLEDQVADAPDDPAALGRRDGAPGALVERLPGGPDGPVDVLGIALGHVRQRLAGGRVGVSNVLPEAASTHCPLMNSLRGAAVNSSTVRSTVTVINGHLLAARRGRLPHCSCPHGAARGHQSGTSARSVGSNNLTTGTGVKQGPGPAFGLAWSPSASA